MVQWLVHPLANHSGSAAKWTRVGISAVPILFSVNLLVKKCRMMDDGPMAGHTHQHHYCAKKPTEFQQLFQWNLRTQTRDPNVQDPNTTRLQEQILCNYYTEISRNFKYYFYEEKGSRKPTKSRHPGKNWPLGNVYLTREI